MTAWNPHPSSVRSRSIEMYSFNHGSVLLNAANAKGFEANFLKNTDLGFISMIEMAPPVGRMRQASSNIDLRIELRIEGD